MNQTSVVITTLLHYNVQVRDTLEYCLRKDQYDTNLFNEKKRSVLVEVDQHTPLKNIIDNSGENGEKLEKAIRDFYAEVYGEDISVDKTEKKANGISLFIEDGIIDRGKDILNKMIELYNRRGRAEKDEMAVNTAKFIEERLGHIYNDLAVSEKDKLWNL